MIEARLDHKKFADALRGTGLTQEKFAEQIGITDRHVRNLAKNDTKISTSTLYLISAKLDISMDNLLILHEK